MLKRRMTLILVVLFAIAILAACSPGGQTTTTSGTGTTTTTGGSTTETSVSEETVEFTWYRAQINRNAITYWNDALWIQELENRMNVKINFEGPLVGAASTDYIQAVQILLNSADFPEVLFFNWNNYSGGLAGAIEDGIVINVSKNPDYWARVPNWQALQDSNEMIRRSVTLDDGSSALFCHVEESTNRNAWNGYALRGDWLEATGLDEPNTIDELYAVLTAFKEADSSRYPMTDESGRTLINNLLPAWGMKSNNTVPYPDPDNPGKITFWTLYKDGEAFRDFVTTMNKWYSEGLIDPDFVSQDWDGRAAKVTTGVSGFTFLLPQFYSSWRTAIVTANPELEGEAYFLGLRPLIGPAGKRYTHNGLNSWAATTAGNVITVKAEQNGNVERILDVINYMYSPEGTDLISWGVEGVSYNINSEGKKEWSELVTNDPDFNFGDAVFKYAIPTWGDWPKIMSYEAWLAQETADPDAAVAHQKYLEADPTLSMPNMVLTQAESEEYNRIMNDVVTLVNEYFMNLITGVRPLSDIDVLLQQIESMGIRDAMEIYQGVYDRFLTK